MLTKDFQRSYHPAVAGTPEIPFRPAYTTCTQAAAPGHWETKCSRIDVPADGGIRIPPNGQLVVVRDPSGAIDPVTGEVKVIDAYIRVCTTVWLNDGPSGPSICTTFPEQAFVPARPGTPGRVETVASLGWDSGANSVQAEEGDCVCTFNMVRVVGAVCGFTAELEDVTDLSRYSHALYFHGGKFQVMENGRARTADKPYLPGDEFKIQRATGVVTYLHAGRPVYISHLASEGAINVGGSLFASSDTIGGVGPAPSGTTADALAYYSGYGPLYLTAAELGLTVPTFPAPEVINLLDLPGASVTVAPTNACGEALAVSVVDGIFATDGTQSTGTCADSGSMVALTLQGAKFPFPSGEESLYEGRLLVTQGFGQSSGSFAMVYVLLTAQGETLGETRYYTLTPGDVDNNSGSVSGTEAVGKMAAAYEGDGLQVVVSVLKSSPTVAGTFQVSTNLALTLPPPQPRRFLAILEQHWAAIEFEGLEDFAFPNSPGTVDGVTTIPILCDAEGPRWDRPEPVIDMDWVKLKGEVLQAVFNTDRGYQAGIFAGDEGYANMRRVGTLKILPEGGSGGGT